MTILDPNNEHDLTTAAKLLKEGQIIGFPTETVWGIGATFDEKGAFLLTHLKNRKENKPLSLHVSNLDLVLPFLEKPSNDFFLLSRVFWPGPLTLVVPKKSNLFTWLSKDNTLGIRFPSHKVSLSFIEKCGGMILATSANMSGNNECKNAQELQELFKEQIGAVLDDGSHLVNKASTVLFLGPQIILLREGFIKKEEIEEVTHKKILLKSFDKIL